MKIDFGIQPNCSEVAFVIYKDKLNEKQLKYARKFLADKRLHAIITPLGNISIELDDKSQLWELKEKFHEIAEFIGNPIPDEFTQTVRDESYYDMIDEKRI